MPFNRSPFDIDGELRRAIQYHRSGQPQVAQQIYRSILDIDPDHSESLHLLGLIAIEAGKNVVGANLINRAIQNDPNNPAYHNNLGIAFQNEGELNEAILCFQKTIQLEPSYFKAYTNMGNAFQDQGKLDEAISCHQRALRLEPNFAEAHNNMGNAFQAQGKSNEAIACYQRALRLKPDLAEACSELAHQLQGTCAWQQLERVTAKLDDFTEGALHQGAKSAETPFISVTRHADLSRNLAVAESWSSDIVGSTSSLNIQFSFDGRKSGKTKIAVGYLSNDFRNHATAHLMLSLFGLHNRDEFGIYCYSYGPDDGSDYRARIQLDCDKFVDIRHLSHADAAQCIYEDQIDILVDLKGYTKGSRLAICAFRPAPIQITYLGFPGTTGADFFDYIITDRIVTPEHHAPYYSETFVYLPHCYQVNDHSQSISDKNWTKKDLGLPAESFVFSSFNHPYKVDPVMFDLWMKILSQVPESVLWLMKGSETAEKNLRQEAERRGVKPDRLIFADKLPKDEHLARYKLSGLALDTRIVNGHTTTSDALWAGVPVITLMGTHFASRVSSSILTAIGLPELITRSLEEYAALAVRLAHNRDELEAIRQKLSQNRLIESLFDTPRFAKNLESAYKEMWNIFSAGQSPRQIELEDQK